MAHEGCGTYAQQTPLHNGRRPASTHPNELVQQLLVPYAPA